MDWSAFHTTGIMIALAVALYSSSRSLIRLSFWIGGLFVAGLAYRDLVGTLHTPMFNALSDALMCVVVGLIALRYRSISAAIVWSVHFMMFALHGGYWLQLMSAKMYLHSLGFLLFLAYMTVIIAGGLYDRRQLRGDIKRLASACNPRWTFVGLRRPLAQVIG